MFPHPVIISIPLEHVQFHIGGKSQLIYLLDLEGFTTQHHHKAHAVMKIYYGQCNSCKKQKFVNICSIQLLIYDACYSCPVPQGATNENRDCNGSVLTGDQKGRLIHECSQDFINRPLSLHSYYEIVDAQIGQVQP